MKESVIYRGPKHVGVFPILVIRWTPHATLSPLMKLIFCGCFYHDFSVNSFKQSPRFF